VQQVAARPRLHDRAGIWAPERAAQARDRDLQRLDRARRGLITEQQVDELLGRHQLVGMNQQQRQQSALAFTPKREGLTVAADLERPQHPKLE
jgi:hypothetical protein